MKLVDFMSFERILAIKIKMGIPIDRLGSLTYLHAEHRLTDDELENLDENGLDISLDELTFLEDGTLAYKNSRVILYIRDCHFHRDRLSEPKFHLADCATLKNMRKSKRFERYVVSTNISGIFLINIIDGGHVDSLNKSLDVCQNCLAKINWQGFHNHLNQQEKSVRVSEFKLDDFFRAYPKSLHPPNNNNNFYDSPLDIYSKNFRNTANRIKELSQWKCSSCQIDLSASSTRKWLHVHHINGLKHDNSDHNLCPLCIMCHADQPKHSHMKGLTDYHDFLMYKRQTR